MGALRRPVLSARRALFNRPQLGFALLLALGSLGCGGSERPREEVVVEGRSTSRLVRSWGPGVELDLRAPLDRTNPFDRLDERIRLPLPATPTLVSVDPNCALRGPRLRARHRNAQATVYTLGAGPAGLTAYALEGQCERLMLGGSRLLPPRVRGERIRLPAGASARFEVRTFGGESLRLRLGDPARVTLSGAFGQPLRRLSVKPGARRIPLRRDGVLRVEVSPESADSAGALLDVDVVQPAHTPRARTPLRGFVVVVVDTLRADRLGVYGGHLPTPHFDALAESGARFANAYSTSSWTKPAVASALTGRYPWEHGATNHRASLPSDVPMVVEALRAEGVQTAALVANGYISRRFGFDRGWDRFAHLGLMGRGRGAQVTAEARRWMAAQDGPFFLYVHTTDVHSPYLPSEEWLRRVDPEPYSGPVDFTGDPLLLRRLGQMELRGRDRERLRALYDAGVLEHDATLGALFADLAGRDDVGVLLVADHGEELFDHGDVGHGGDRLHEELLRVPMLLRWPGVTQPGEAPRTAVSLVDVGATVLDAFGLGETFGSGRSLRHQLGAPRERFVAFGGVRRGLSDGRFKWVLDPAGGAALFDLSQDPSTTRNLSRDAPVAAALLEHALQARMASSPERLAPSEAVVPDDDLRAQLRNLGYLDE